MPPQSSTRWIGCLLVSWARGMLRRAGIDDGAEARSTRDGNLAPDGAGIWPMTRANWRRGSQELWLLSKAQVRRSGRTRMWSPGGGEMAWALSIAACREEGSGGGMWTEEILEATDWQTVMRPRGWSSCGEWGSEIDSMQAAKVRAVTRGYPCASWRKEKPAMLDGL